MYCAVSAYDELRGGHLDLNVQCELSCVIVQKV